MDLSPGAAFPDLRLADHAGNDRSLSELVAGDPVVLQTYRGWWCPKEQAFFRRLVALQDEVEVELRAHGLAQRRPAAGHRRVPRRARRALDVPVRPRPRRRAELGLRETTDTVNDPYVPAVFTLLPDLTIHRAYDGYWYWGRPDARGAAPGPAGDHARGRARLGGAGAMSWCWLALVDDAAAGRDASAAAPSRRQRPPEGWPRGGGAPSRCARARASTRAIVDPAGAAAWSRSCARPPACACPSTTSPSSRRGARVLAGAPFDAVSTLLSDASHFEGSITVARGAQARAAARRPVRPDLPRADPGRRAGAARAGRRRRPARRSSATAAPAVAVGPLRRVSTRRQPAVDGPQRARDVGALVGGQEGDDAGDLVRRCRRGPAGSAPRAPRALGVVHPPVVHRRLGDAGQHAVDADAVGGVVGRHDAHEAGHAGLAGRVGVQSRSDP